MKIEHPTLNVNLSRELTEPGIPTQMPQAVERVERERSGENELSGNFQAFRSRRNELYDV